MAFMIIMINLVWFNLSIRHRLNLHYRYFVNVNYSWEFHVAHKYLITPFTINFEQKFPILNMLGNEKQNKMISFFEAC